MDADTMTRPIPTGAQRTRDWDRMGWHAQTRWLNAHVVRDTDIVDQRRAAAAAAPPELEEDQPDPHARDDKGRRIWSTQQMKAGAAVARAHRAGRGPAPTPDQLDAARAWDRKLSAAARRRRGAKAFKAAPAKRPARVTRPAAETLALVLEMWGNTSPEEMVARLGISADGVGKALRVAGRPHQARPFWRIRWREQVARR